MRRSQRQAKSSEEQEARAPNLGRYVASLENAVYKGIAQEVSPYDLLPLDIHLLTICLEMGECTATQLAALLPVDASRVSRLVTGLAEKGLLRRRRLRNDRRVVMLRLSPAGEELTTEVDRRMQAYYAKLTEGISASAMRSFATAAMRITANYQAMQGE